MIVKENSKSFQFDLKWLRDIAIAIWVALSTFYVANTEVVNSVIWKYVEADMLALIVTILGYITEKFITNYSK